MAAAQPPSPSPSGSPPGYAAKNDRYVADVQRAIKGKEVDPDDAYNFASDKRLFAKYVTDRSLLPKFESE